MSLQSIARALEGTISGNQVLAPGPNHSRHDRSLAVWVDGNSPDGFTCHSFAGDDWRGCRDYVRGRLGMPEWQPGSLQDSALRPVITVKQAQGRHDDGERVQHERAMTLWGEGVQPRGTLVELYLQRRHLSLSRDVMKAD